MDTPTNKISLAEDLLSLCQTMLSSAQAGHWDDLDGMVEQRGELIVALFADGAAVLMGSERLRFILQEVQIMGNALMKLVAQERDQTSQQLMALRNARKGESVYASALDEEASE